MITYSNGRFRSHRPAEEARQLIADELKGLSTEEREALDLLIQELTTQQNQEVLDAAERLEWDPDTGPPVPIAQWVNDEYYLGETARTLWPKLKEDMIEFFEGDYAECILTGSTRWGKDYFSTTALVRIIYELYCLKRPTDTLGLGRGETIHIVPISHTKEAAQRVVFKGIVSKMALCPFWKGRYEYTKEEIRFPGKDIVIIAGGSNEGAALGLNVWAALMDEGNFFAKQRKGHVSAGGGKEDKSEGIYDSLRRRIRGTYAAKGLRGRLIMISSKKSIHDFTERRLREAIKDEDNSVFCRDYCLASDTKVPLLDGTTPTIKELTENYRDSEERFWVYSIDPATGLVVPGKAHHPHLTKTNEAVYKVTLDNDESVRVTGNHPFMLRSGAYRRAEDLRPGDSLMSLGRLAAVVSVERDGEDDVYDLSVEQFENFALDIGVFVHNSTWDVSPNAFQGQKWWRAAVSQKIGRVRVLEDDEEPEDHEIWFKFPDEYLKEFKNDPAGAARDIAGIALESFRPFFSNREAIQDMQKPTRGHPFHVYEWDTGRKITPIWENITMNNVHGDPVPRCCPNAHRHCHMDLSKNRDATGLCVGHVAGETEVDRLDPMTHERRKENAPVIHVDLCLRIMAPHAGEIQHELVRGLIYQLREGGLPIKSVSADRWMGLPNLQLISRHGFKTEEISTQRNLDPYLAAQSAMYERRIETPMYPFLAKELRELELNEQGTKVDHPKTGSKDVADAFAATVFYLSKNWQSIGVGGVSMGTVATETGDTGEAVMTADGNFRWPDEPPIPADGEEDWGGLPTFII